MALTDAEIEIARAVALTLFPAEGVIAVDAEQAGVIQAFARYVEGQDVVGQAATRALLQATELGFAAWARSPRARFTTASSDDRWAFLESWSKSGNAAQRMAFEGLRTMLLLGYVDSDPVRRAMGNFGDGGPVPGQAVLPPFASAAAPTPEA